MEFFSNLQNSQNNTTQREEENSDDSDIIDEENILKYEELINEIEMDLRQGKKEENQEELVCCEIEGEKKVSVRRNRIEGVVKVSIDLPCSINRKGNQKVEAKNEKESGQEIGELRDNKNIQQLLNGKDIVIEKYKQTIDKSNQEIQKYKYEIDILMKRIQQLQAELEIVNSCDPQISEIQQQKYEDIINELESKIKTLQLQQNNDQINTLKIVKGQQTTILDLQSLPITLQQNQTNTIKYFTSRQLSSIFQQPTPFNPPQFQQLTAQYSSLIQTSSDQIQQLKSYISSLLSQLHSLKIQNQKSHNLILQYQLKLSNRRDFYKVKLIDLQHLIKQKTQHLHQLNKTLTSISHQINQKMNGYSSLQPLISSYTTTIQHINSKLQQQQSNTHDLQLALQQKNNRIEQLNRTIQELTKQIQLQHSYLNEVKNELGVTKSTQERLGLVINKLEENIKDLNMVIGQKNKDIAGLKERMKVQSENEEDMKMLIDDMSNELMNVKEELFIKRQEFEELEEKYKMKSEELKQYESQVRLQAMEIKQLVENNDRTEEVILGLRSKIQEDQSSKKIYNNDSGKKTHYQSGKKVGRNRNDMVQQLRRMKLGENNISVQMVLKLIQIIEEYGQDINSLQNQNEQFRQLIIDYEQIIQKQLLEIKRSKIQDQPEARLGKKTLSRIRSNNSLSPHPNNYLSLNIQQLQHYQQLASDLQKQRKQNILLNHKLKQTHKQLMQSQRQIFQKTEAINYLNLALIKASNEQTTSLQQEIVQLKSLNQHLEENIKKIAKSKSKEIENLEYQINLLDNNVIPELKNENSHYVRTIAKLEAENNKLMKQLQKGGRNIKVFDETKVLNEIRLQKNNLTLEQFKLKKLSYSVVLYMMLKLIQTLESTQHMKTFHPQDIHIINYNQHQPSSFKIKLSFCQKSHNNGIFTAPQIIKGQPQSLYSISWNFGLIFDYLFFKQPFYLTQKDISKKPYQPRGKIPYLIQKLLQSLIVKQKRKRLSLQQCKSIVQIQLNK